MTAGNGIEAIKVTAELGADLELTAMCAERDYDDYVNGVFSAGVKLFGIVASNDDVRLYVSTADGKAGGALPINVTGACESARDVGGEQADLPLTDTVLYEVASLADDFATRPAEVAAAILKYRGIIQAARARGYKVDMMIRNALGRSELTDLATVGVDL